jgi:hypothetical protein
MEKNPDYSETVIYKIVPNNELKYCYVGNTCDIECRIKNHRSNCENFNSKAYNRLLYKTIRENGGWSEWSLIVIEKFPCNNDIEARQKEQFYIKELNANLNIIRAFRTEDEKIEQINKDNRTPEQIREKTKKYYNENKEICNETSKLYYHTNKEYFEEKRKEYYELHKEELSEKSKIYRELNKEKIKQRDFEIIKCVCGKSFIKKSKSRHEKTLKHLDYINNLTNTTFEK